MADAKVNIVGNSEDAQRAVDKLRASFEKLEDKLRNQAKFSKQAQTAGSAYLQSQQQFATSLVTNIVSVQAAWELAKKALQNYIDTNQKMLDQRDTVAPDDRETKIKVINQGGLNKAESKEIFENINKQVMEIPASDVTSARRMTEEMLSQNYDRQSSINATTLREILKLKAATNQFGPAAMNDKTLVSSVAAIIRNDTGRDSTKPIMPEEIEKLAKEFHSLFLQGTIQLEDLEFLGRIKASMGTRRVDNATQMAAFSVARDSFGSGDTAATFLNQAILGMNKVGSAPMLKKLKKQGIDVDASRFDLVGEDLPTALENMVDEISKLKDDREKDDARLAMFGTKSSTGVTNFESKVKNIRIERDKILNSMKNEGFDTALDQFRTSDFSQAAMISNNAQIKSMEGRERGGNLTFGDVDKLLSAVFEELNKQGVSPTHLAISKATADAAKQARMGTETPQEYLGELIGIMHQKKAIDQSILGGIFSGDDATRSSDILTEQYKKLSMPEIEYRVDFDREKRELEKRKAEERPAAPPAVRFPDQMNVKDPDLQTSVNTLNGTMMDIRGILGNGPDRQRVIKMPATRTTGTA